MKEKKWNLLVILSTLLILAVVAGVTMVIDPFLHFHGPLTGLEYPLKDERYLNDGIARHYDYEAVITGTSMTQNFKTSEFEALWGVPAIKVAYSGASYHELNESIRRVFAYNPDVQYVLCSMDGNKLIYPAKADEYEGYPDYLYDQNPFNDVSYLLNKEVVPKTIAVLNFTRAGNRTPSMDEYGSWGPYKAYGKEAVLGSFTLMEETEEEVVLSEEEIQMTKENVTLNFLQTALEHPKTDFYLFFPPYSVYYWDALVRTKQINAQLEAEKIAVELLLEAENIHIFAYADRIDITAEADNYTDTLHYGEWINSEILKWIHAGEGELTKENYEEYFLRVKEIYTNYEVEY